MAKPAFRRGLQQEFVDRLNHMYRCGGWWSNLVDDDELFLAIRDDFVNLYFRGCSVLKLSWLSKKKEITGEIHYKYLLKPSIKKPYIKFRESRLALPEDLRSMFLDGLDDTNELKRAVATYVDAEKEGVHDVVMSSENPNVLDLEIAIREGKSVPRIDLAALARDTDRSGSVKLVFYEAKHFQNPELRSRTDTIPVVDQMNNYSDLIIKNRDALLASYRQVCCNLFSLEGVGRQNSERHQILRDIATESKELEIDDQPRLIAFGFDQDQQEGKNWKPHAAKLKNALGKERVLFAGEAGDIRLEKR